MLANSLDLLFVTVAGLAAGRSSNVLFMKTFDKSLSVLLMLIVVVLVGHGSATMDIVDGRDRRENEKKILAE